MISRLAPRAEFGRVAYLSLGRSRAIGGVGSVSPLGPMADLGALVFAFVSA